MAITNLRRADLEELPSEEGLSNLSASNLELVSSERKPVEPMFDEYPFEQEKIVADLVYSEPSEFTSGREINLDLQYRTGSRLLVLEVQTDFSLSSVFNELTQNAGTSDRIYHSLHAPEDRLWSFIKEAERTLEIRVLDEGREVPYREVEETPVEEVIGSYAIEYAQVGFVIEEKESGTAHDIVVTYDSGRLQIETDWEDGPEYILQVFEAEVLADQ